MAKIDKGIDGRYELTARISYEIKNSAPLQYSVTMSKKELRTRVKDLKRLSRALRRMIRHGWNIQNVEAGVDE